MAIFEVIFCIIALIFIILEGYYFDTWHELSKNDPWLRSETPRGYKVEHVNIPRLQQVLINGVGSTIGWLVTYYFIFYRLKHGLVAYQPRISDLFLLLIAYYGIVGQLPNVLLVKLFQAPKELVEKLIGK